eukprot:CAMPEP_0194749076 /NCGR_PEP_ID=MMETSP0323_2-20130528/3283_1 /TAXON_ID=2866 ORGANISM="Crypthecodinium cohnii, Strain Seligo" /NCGR_SAMPLE_ID=MMETSP0323_2 /ASSEMBLY_ACC=CAM_ASM_000346 /LENGTH=87 /DNA_ID=CAMNT_0039663907 /DNA_START=17 /DNA_END=280 /DNA_ORIENTATION=-
MVTRNESKAFSVKPAEQVKHPMITKKMRNDQVSQQAVCLERALGDLEHGQPGHWKRMELGQRFRPWPMAVAQQGGRRGSNESRVARN